MQQLSTLLLLVPLIACNPGQKQNKQQEAIKETLYLLNIPGMRESIREGLVTPIEECSEDIDW